jgi:hypothetical protein
MIKLFLLLSIISVSNGPQVFYKAVVFDSLEKCMNAIVPVENVLMMQSEQLNHDAVWIQSQCLEFEGFPPDFPS